MPVGVCEHPVTRFSLIHSHGLHISAKLRFTRVPKELCPLVSAGRPPAQCLPLCRGVLVIFSFPPSKKTALHSEPGHVQAGEPGFSTARALLTSSPTLGRKHMAVKGFAGEPPRSCFACSSVHGGVSVAVSRHRAPQVWLQTRLSPRTWGRWQHPELEPRSRDGAQLQTFSQLK